MTVPTDECGEVIVLHRSLGCRGMCKIEMQQRKKEEERSEFKKVNLSIVLLTTVIATTGSSACLAMTREIVCDGSGGEDTQANPTRKRRGRGIHTHTLCVTGETNRQDTAPDATDQI